MHSRYCTTVLVTLNPLFLAVTNNNSIPLTTYGIDPFQDFIHRLS